MSTCLAKSVEDWKRASAGNIEESIDLLTNLVIGLVISCCTIFNIFGEMPACPVAFLTFNLFICNEEKLIALD
jgi:hypothetical protein